MRERNLKISAHTPNCHTLPQNEASGNKAKRNSDIAGSRKDPACLAELDQLIGKRDHRKFLNSRNEFTARERWRDPPSRDEALKLMAAART